MPAPSIQQLFRDRASTRHFDARPVDDATIQALLEAARWAPSWGNRQPWRFVVARQPGTREALAATFTPGNAWAARAPALIAVAADPAEGKGCDGLPYYLFDCGLATENLILEAVARGLGAHPFGGWDEARARAALDIPEGMRLAVIVAVGYPGTPPPIRPGERGERPRERLSLACLCHGERWNGPLALPGTEADGG